MRKNLFLREQEGSAGSTGTAEKIEIEVNGQVIRLTQEELIAEAQKARGVLPKLQSEHDQLKNRVEEMEQESKLAQKFISAFDKVIEGGEGAEQAISLIANAAGMKPRELAVKFGGRPLPDQRKPKRRRDYDEDEDFDDEDDDSDDYGFKKDKPVNDSGVNKPFDINALPPEIRKTLEWAEKERLQGRQGQHVH
jgi:hypothetical protein